MKSILVLKNLGIQTVGGYPGELVSVNGDVSAEQMDALTKALAEGKKQFWSGTLSTYEVIRQAMDTTFGQDNWGLPEFTYKEF